MQRVYLLTISLCCLFAAPSCNPLKAIDDAVPDVEVKDPPKQYLGYIEIDGKRWEIRYSDRSVWSGLELSAQTNRPDTNASGVNSCRFYIGGGSLTETSYEIIADEDDLDMTNKQVAINYHDLLSGSDYNSMDGELSKAEITIAESGKMTITVPKIQLVKDWGKGNDTITFSCQVIEKEDTIL